MRYGSLFSGYGGLDLAVEEVFGAQAAWHCEIEPAACRVLEARWPGVPNIGDVSEVDWSTVEPVQILAGGFPCTDVSTAGRVAGLSPDSRSGLWSRFALAIERLRPELVVIENVRGLTNAPATHPAHELGLCPGCMGGASERTVLRALGAVLGDLADLGFDAEWVGLRASDVGAPHSRFRIFIVAWPAADTDGREVRMESVRLAGSATTALAEHALRETDPGRRGDSPAADSDAGGFGPGLEHLLERATDAARLDPKPDLGEADWGAYEPAVRRWESVLGRVVPRASIVGPRGTQKLSPYFVEWMMGLPEGHVTDVLLTPDLNAQQRSAMTNAALKMLGNGVVWQQAAAGIRELLVRAFAPQILERTFYA